MTRGEHRLTPTSISRRSLWLKLQRTLPSYSFILEVPRAAFFAQNASPLLTPQITVIKPSQLP